MPDEPGPPSRAPEPPRVAERPVAEQRPVAGQRPKYKGAPLDEARGPGLGCFRFQVGLFVVLVVLTPIGAANDWPFPLVAGMLFLTIGLLFFVGQTAIFLLRLVAVERRERRRPLRAGSSPTVGQLEDAARGAPSAPVTPPDQEG